MNNEIYPVEYGKKNTIFDKISINRDDVKWEDYLYKLTPVERHGNLYFKREDKFAPLGFGGINGSKLRQAIHLVYEYFKKNKGPICGGTVLKSPQSPMLSAVALHFGLESINVYGATKKETAIKTAMVQMAGFFKSKFDIINIAYNSGLQKRVQEIVKEKNGFYLEYGITLSHKLHSQEAVKQFHIVGAEQVKNIPDDVECLIMPMGSANSVTSVLYGLLKYGHKNIKQVYLIGIGPNRIKFLLERLNYIEKGLPDYFTLVSNDNPLLNHFGKNARFICEHYDLHTTNWVKYSDERPFNYSGIELHPTYEGKVMSFITKHLSHLVDGTKNSLFWIVGSKPYIHNMEAFTPELKPPLTLNMIKDEN